MNIWYLHHYGTPREIYGLHRPFEFGEYFNKKGHKTTVFSSSYLHYVNSNMIEDSSKYLIKKYNDVDAVFVKTCGYENSGSKRVLNMFQFGYRLVSVGMEYAKKTENPDVIIASSPHPFTMLAGLKLAKKFGVPCICEVRDFWPEVFFYGGVLKETSLLGKLLLCGERYIYTKADGITFLKEGDHTYITEKGWDIEHCGKIDMSKCIYVNNGIDIKRYDNQMLEFVSDDEDFCDDKFTIVYCGTIRPVNNVDMILDVAKILGDEYRFLIYGTGNCVELIQKRLEDEKIHNVKLKGYIDNQFIPSVLCRSSLNLLNYSGSAYNWSRGNSSNKLFEYLASGRPVLSTVKMGYDIIERYSCGSSVEHTTPEEIAEKIREIREMDCEAYSELCKNARTAAEDFDIPKLSYKYLCEIDRIIKKYNSKERRENEND